MFKIAIVATMSSGKSTLINSLLGRELMHSANEATTAKITSIEQNNDVTLFSGYKKYDNPDRLSDEVLLDIEEKNTVSEIDLQLWNSDSNVKEIQIAGPFRNLSNMGLRIRLYDTPGPNNSQDDTHSDILKKFIDGIRLDALIYVINATQIGINDDRRLLQSIILPELGERIQNIIFVVNKIDCLDVEKGETLDNTLLNVRNYLQSFDHEYLRQPLIIPLSAESILTVSKYLDNEKLSRKERGGLMKSINMILVDDEYMTYEDFQNLLDDERLLILEKLMQISGLNNLDAEIKYLVQMQINERRMERNQDMLFIKKIKGYEQPLQ